MMAFIKKLFGGGGAPGINVGIGTSMVCFLIGHAWFRKIAAIYVKYGCPHCGAEGKLPLRPEGGGSMSAEVCPVCKGSKFDPNNPPPPELLEGKKKRKRWHRDDVPDVPLPDEDEEAADPSWWERFKDWWLEVRGKQTPVEPTDVPWETRPWKKVKFNAGTCRRCGATQGAWTEPIAQVGILGRILRWLF